MEERGNDYGSIAESVEQHDDDDSDNPFSKACRKASLDVVHTLVREMKEHGTLRGEKTHDVKTMLTDGLSGACAAGRVDVLVLLKDEGVDPNRYGDYLGMYPQPLVIACTYVFHPTAPDPLHVSLRMVEALIASGADPNGGSWCPGGTGPAEALREMVFKEDCYEHHVRLLLEAGADARAMLDEPFVSAYIQAHPSILRLLRGRHVEEMSGRYRPPEIIMGSRKFVERGDLPLSELYDKVLAHDGRVLSSSFYPSGTLENMEAKEREDADYRARRIQSDSLLREFLREERARQDL